ncbi:MAG: GHKL domain-containing protein [Clostridiales bacterium]|nr:GHKL domain-containing protein [Clostridiales bacterium]
MRKFREDLNREAEEKRMNTIMFWEMIFIPVTAWGFVHFFVNGTMKDAIVLLMAVCSILIRIFENKLGKYAKYLYISIMPIWGPIIIVFTNDGKFSAIEYAYIWAIIICIAGYDLSTMIINAALTIGINIIAMILFPEPYLQMHHLPLWTYILLLYIMSLFTSLSVHQRLRKQERLHEQMEIYKTQMEVMQQTEKKVRGLRHDMKHHVWKLRALAEEERYLDILAYLNVIEDFMENSKEYVISGNKEIDAICNFLLDKGVNKGIEVKAECNIPEEIQLPIFEINSILGNLLENAIEAAEESDEKKIQMSIHVSKGVLYITIINSYNGIIEKKGKKYISRKGGEHHGWGLSNVQEMLSRKKGTMRIQHDEKNFKVDVLLYLRES